LRGLTLRTAPQSNKQDDDLNHHPRVISIEEGIIIFVPNQNCSTFQIESGTTELVKNFKIDFFE
jgi:hypothetical protein